MSKVVKPAGKNATQAKGRTSHGSAYEASYNRLEGKTANRDRKPNGFLSRHSKPASGRKSGGPGRDDLNTL
jgi:hypothetical protein